VLALERGQSACSPEIFFLLGLFLSLALPSSPLLAELQMYLSCPARVPVHVYGGGSVVGMRAASAPEPLSVRAMLLVLLLLRLLFFASNSPGISRKCRHKISENLNGCHGLALRPSTSSPQPGPSLPFFESSGMCFENAAVEQGLGPFRISKTIALSMRAADSGGFVTRGHTTYRKRAYAPHQPTQISLDHAQRTTMTARGQVQQNETNCIESPNQIRPFFFLNQGNRRHQVDVHT
jgi:hypothetical protein